MDRNDREIVGIVMLSHALVHTYELTIPIFMVVWLTEFSTTAATLGIIVAAGYGLFGLGAVPSGIVSDRYGSRRMIALCLLGMGLSFVVLGFATGLGGILAAVCLWGAAASIYHPAGLSLISTGVSETGDAFAFHGMAGNVGIAFGPLVAVLLLVVVDWRVAAMALAVPAFVALAVIWRVSFDEMAAVEPTANPHGRAKPGVESLDDLVGASRALFLSGFAFVFVMIVFNGLYYRGLLTFLPDILAGFMAVEPAAVGGSFVDQLNPSEFVYVGLLMLGIVGQYVGGKSIGRVAVEKGLLVGYGALAAIAVLFVPALAMGVGPAVAVSLLLGFSLFLLQPLYQYAVAKYTPPESRGLSYGYTYLAQFGVGALGAAVIGVVLTVGGRTVAFVVIAGFAVVAAVVVGSLWWRQ